MVGPRLWGPIISEALQAYQHLEVWDHLLLVLQTAGWGKALWINPGFYQFHLCVSLLTGSISAHRVPSASLLGLWIASMQCLLVHMTACGGMQEGQWKTSRFKWKDGMLRAEVDHLTTTAQGRMTLTHLICRAVCVAGDKPDCSMFNAH